MSKLLLLLAVLATPAVAWPCSPPPPLDCSPGSTAPRAGELVPANLPGLVVRSAAPNESGQAPELLDPQGNAVPLQPGARDELKLSGPLESAASYTLRFALDCKGPPAELTFTTTEPKPLPTGTGTLSQRALGRFDSNVFTSRGSCNTPAQLVGARLGLTPSPELVPFLPIARFETRVDGEPWGTLPAGARFPEVPSSDAPGIVFMGADLLFARCDARIDGDQNGLEPGVHQVEVRAQLAGRAEPLEAAKLEVELHCAEPSTQPCSPDSPVPQPLCGVDEPEEPAGCGCSSGARPGPSAALLAPGALLRRRRGKALRT